MLQTSALRRPYGNQTLIYNWLEDRADVKNERILKPLPSQVYFSYLIHSLRIYIYLHSTIIILLTYECGYGTVRGDPIRSEVRKLERKFLCRINRSSK
jgi:hypothetical protein